MNASFFFVALFRVVKKIQVLSMRPALHLLWFACYVRSSCLHISSENHSVLRSISYESLKWINYLPRENWGRKENISKMKVSELRLGLFGRYWAAAHANQALTSRMMNNLWKIREKCRSFNGILIDGRFRRVYDQSIWKAVKSSTGRLSLEVGSREFQGFKEVLERRLYKKN